MKKRELFLAAVAIVLVSICCGGPPRFMPAGVDLADADRHNLQDQIAGNYQIDQLYDHSEIAELENRCQPSEAAIASTQETIRFQDNKLIISDDQGERVYLYQDWGYQNFCRELEDGKLECIHNFTPGSDYRISVYANVSNLQPCYDGQKNIISLESPQIEQEDSAPPAVSDPQPNPLPEQPEPEPDPEPEYAEPGECNAASSLSVNYSDAILKTSPSDETSCDYTVTFTNTGNQSIKVFLYKSNRFYTGDGEYKWDNYLSLGAGESYAIDCDKETRNNDGSFRFYFIEKVAPIFDTQGCMNTFKNNSSAKDGIEIVLHLPCE